MAAPCFGAAMVEPLTVESRHVAFSKLPLKHLERRGFGAERGLAHIAHVVGMKVNKLAEGLEARDT